jgi:hypothetical protein
MCQVSQRKIFFALFAVLLWPAAAIRAQRSQPIGAIGHHGIKAAAVRSLPTQSKALTEASASQRAFWTWTGIGVLGGGIIGAIWSSVVISREEDPMLSGFGVALGTGAGAIVGGLVGALSYALFHTGTPAEPRRLAIEGPR